MKKTPKCKYCDEEGHYETFCRRKPRKQIVTRKPLEARSRPLRARQKPIRQQGKHAKLWSDTRAEFVRLNPERICYVCSGEATDVDHILKRSTHPQLRYEQSNLAWICRACHILKDQQGLSAKEIRKIRRRQ